VIPAPVARRFEEEAAQTAVEQFKRETTRKIQHLRCPIHHQSPRLRFEGATLRDITIRMSGCCESFMALANRRIAERGPQP
jgi:hypothetical protein